MHSTDIWFQFNGHVLSTPECPKCAVHLEGYSNVFSRSPLLFTRVVDHDHIPLDMNACRQSELLRAETKGGDKERTVSSLHGDVQAKEKFFSPWRQVAREKQHGKKRKKKRKYTPGNSSHFHETRIIEDLVQERGLHVLLIIICLISACWIFSSCLNVIWGIGRHLYFLGPSQILQSACQLTPLECKIVWCVFLNLLLYSPFLPYSPDR